MNNNRNRHFYIDSHASTDKLFTLLDAVQIDNEDEIDQLMNNFDTEFMSSEEIEIIDNPGNMSALTLETNVNFVDQGTTHTKELREKQSKDKQKEKKVRRKYLDHMETQCFSTFMRLLSS